MQMSTETGIQDVRVSIKEIQMSSETGIQDVRVFIVRIAKICRRAAHRTHHGSWFSYKEFDWRYKLFCAEKKSSVNNAEIWCFHIFHRLALKYGKADTMLRCTASKFFIASRQNVKKSEQC